MDPIPVLNAALADRYAIEREIGAGGMATVYLAHDVRHDRRVALKVLRPELGAVLGVERFLAEIRVTANLQHPNILPLFDSGEADGLLYYVMPFVDGETLRARLDQEKQLPVEEAIAITRAIAGALDYAHSARVIHRDLKPENILFQAGQPVLADFGIALAVANAGGTRITQTGLSLGTPQYMSPEQATGDRVIDGRTDIYSLAAVLYEMLTGEAPHTGTTAQAIIARVLTDKPRSIRASRTTVPLHVEAAIERALAKLPADRFATAHEFSQALSGAFAVTATAPAMAPQPAALSLAVSRAALVRAAKIMAAAVVIALGLWGWLRPRPVAHPLRAKFVIELPDSMGISGTLFQRSVVISPDGSEFIYPSAWNGGTLLRRRLDDFRVTEVPGGRQAWNPRYSSDGAWVALELNGRLAKVPLAGGPNVPLADSVSRPSWGDDGTIVFVRPDGLWKVSGDGGPVTRLTEVDRARGERSHQWPFVLPGGRNVLFDVWDSTAQSSDDYEIAVVRVADGSITRMGLHGSDPRYVRPGYLLFSRQDGSVSAVAFDLEHLRTMGGAVTVLSDVFTKAGGAGMYSVSNDGVLVYGSGAADVNVTAVSRDGHERQLTPHSGNYGTASISPDGNRIAYRKRDDLGFDIWVLPLATGQEYRLTRDGNNLRPDWSADGQRVIWAHADSLRTELRWQHADATGVPERIPAPDSIRDFAVNPTGGTVAVVTRQATRTAAVSLIKLDGSGEPRKLLDGEQPDFSPDGRWIAYVTEQSGTADVFIANVSDPSIRLQVSTDGGDSPAWSADGRSLYYRAAGKIVEATLKFAPRLEIVGRNPILNDVYYTGIDVDRKTGELIMITRGSVQHERIVVITDWFDELRERMAGTARR